MSYKAALIIVILGTSLFLLYIWQFGFPPYEEDILPENETTLKEPDSPNPAAGVCDFYEGDSVTFQIQDGIPSPRCARVLSGQTITYFNASPDLLRFEFAGKAFEISSQNSEKDERRVEDYLLPGVHVVSMDLYAGSGPEIWVQDERTFVLEGTVKEQFVSARAIVLETQSGDVSLGLTDETSIVTAERDMISPDNFSLYLTPGTEISAIGHFVEGNTGTALKISIKNSSEPVSCTMEAKLCPDGTAVGRVGPNCEFAPCPSQ